MCKLAQLQLIPVLTRDRSVTNNDFPETFPFPPSFRKGKSIAVKTGAERGRKKLNFLLWPTSFASIFSSALFSYSFFMYSRFGHAIRVLIFFSCHHARERKNVSLKRFFPLCSFCYGYKASP